MFAREVLEPPASARDELLSQTLIADGALERLRDAVRRLVGEEDARVAERLGDRARGVRDDRQVGAHRLEERDAEALVIGQREKRRRAAVVRDELLGVDAAGEGDVLREVRLAHLLLQTLQIRRRHRRRADEVQVRARIAAAVARESGDDVVHRLLREDLSDDEDRGALVGEPVRDVRIRRDVELLPVVEDRDDRGLLQSGGLELLAVELAVGEAELRDRRELVQLGAAELAVALRVIVEAAEVLGGRDVVVNDCLFLRELRDLAEDVVAHRVVDEQECVAGQPLQIAPVADERADLGLGLPREQIAAHVRRPEHPLQLEAVVPDRIAVRDDRMKLMRSAEAARHRSTGSGGLSSIAGNSSSSGPHVASRASSDIRRAGSMISRSPSRRMTASSPGSSNSRGIRTTWLRPILRSLTRFPAVMGFLTRARELPSFARRSSRRRRTSRADGRRQ